MIIKAIRGAKGNNEVGKGVMTSPYIIYLRST